MTADKTRQTISSTANLGADVWAGLAGSADAVAQGDAELFVLTRHEFDALVLAHRMLVINLLEGLAKALAVRLRHANTELRVLQDS